MIDANRWLPRITTLLTASLAVFAIVGCSIAGPGATATDTQGDEGVSFPAGVVFDYQLGGAYEPGADVGLVVRDRTASPAKGVYSVCYINASQTQPGEQDIWPEDTLLTADGEPVADPDWPDKILLDASTSANREAIVGIVSSWIEGCAKAGFKAVEFDNLDSFTRSHGDLTIEDNLALAAALADVAHTAGLAVGQKNAAEFTAQLKDAVSFDFAVAEECAAYEECTAYTDAYGDAVITIEYQDTLPRSFDEICEDDASPASMILRDRDLVTPDDDGYIFQSCDR